MRVRDLPLGRPMQTRCRMLWLVANLPACVGVSEERRTRSMREYELAVSLFGAERNTREAIVAAERALRDDPDNAEAHLLLGQIYGASALYDRAEPHLRRAAEIFRPQAEADPEKVAQLDEARNALAAALIALGRPSEAVVLLRGVIGDVHYASQHLALGNLGWALLTMHKYREAVPPLERSVALEPSFCVGQYRLGEAFLRLNEYGRALEALDRGLQTRQPGCDRIQQAYRVRGEVHAQLHQPDPARSDFTRCRDLAPETRDGRECAALLRTAEGP
jgi:type IV pilus assembly protein PilF